MYHAPTRNLLSPTIGSSEKSLTTLRDSANLFVYIIKLNKVVSNTFLVYALRRYILNAQIIEGVYLVTLC